MAQKVIFQFLLEPCTKGLDRGGGGGHPSNIFDSSMSLLFTWVTVLE